MQHITLDIILIPYPPTQPCRYFSSVETYFPASQMYYSRYFTPDIAESRSPRALWH